MKAIILDDETHCREVLRIELQRHCPDIQILADFNDARQAKTQIAELNPDLVFLDIEMPHMNGFQFLQSFDGSFPFDVIFTTAYDEFAVKAIKMSAVDYLLKPIDPEELKAAVQRARERRDRLSDEEINGLLRRIESTVSHPRQKVVLPTLAGGEFVRISDIVYLRSDSNYTHVVLGSEKDVLVSRTLKDVEALLPGELFLRVHNSFTVNLDHIQRFVRQDGGYLIMDNGDQVSVSRRKKDTLFDRF